MIISYIKIYNDYNDIEKVLLKFEYRVNIHASVFESIVFEENIDRYLFLCWNI